MSYKILSIIFCIVVFIPQNQCWGLDSFGSVGKKLNKAVEGAANIGTKVADATTAIGEGKYGEAGESLLGLVVNNKTLQTVKKGTKALERIVGTGKDILNHAKGAMKALKNPKELVKAAAGALNKFVKELMEFDFKKLISFVEDLAKKMYDMLPKFLQDAIKAVMGWLGLQIDDFVADTPIGEVVAMQRYASDYSNTMNIVLPVSVSLIVLFHLVLLLLGIYFLHIRKLRSKAARQAAKDIEDAKKELANQTNTPSAGSSGASSGTASSGTSTGSSGGPSKGASDVKSKGASDVTSKGASDVTSKGASDVTSKGASDVKSTAEANKKEAKPSPTQPVPMPTQFLSKAEPPKR